MFRNHDFATRLPMTRLQMFLSSIDPVYTIQKAQHRDTNNTHSKQAKRPDESSICGAEIIQKPPIDPLSLYASVRSHRVAIARHSSNSMAAVSIRQCDNIENSLSAPINKKKSCRRHKDATAAKARREYLYTFSATQWGQLCPHSSPCGYRF